ncbi:MAG: hotdog fold thioesterase [Saprospiraceae bacterium]|nr:hotdog fold thioesterase [Saprospiraceae bacterium]
MIWKKTYSLDELNEMSKNTLFEHLGMQFTKIGEDYLEAEMPVDHRTKQPAGLLHGGASVALAETLGSVASVMCIEDLSKETAVGVEINANHLRPATKGIVTGKVFPVKVGRRLHVWEIKIYDEREKQICVSRITIAIVGRGIL